MLYNQQLNVYGEKLASCCLNPITGWERDGSCAYFPEDRGQHLICAEMTDEFLEYSKDKGNDLSSPTPTFPGFETW